MGVIRPPWISKEWFIKCPFNYCDHFGDKETLAKICKICKDDVDREQFYKRIGKNPYDPKYVFQDIAQNFAKVRELLKRDAKRLGIDLNNLSDEDKEEDPPPTSYPIYNMVTKYSNHIERKINNLQIIPIDANKQLIEKMVDILSHSRHYIIAKIARALNSQREEEKDPFTEELADSKTSSFFAYVAIERNSRALHTLARHKPLIDFREENLKLALISLEIAQMIREEFFVSDPLIYEELGCESYNCYFSEETTV